LTLKADPLASVRERLALADRAKHADFECAGRVFTLQAGVFPPTHFQSTHIFAESLSYEPGTSFFELGSGAGAIAVTAALAGCRPVVASDISQDAVENTRHNVLRHGVEQIVSVRHGDLFDVLEPSERFDVIFWNSNLVFVPAKHVFSEPREQAFCDPGYGSHVRFLREAPHHLNVGGRLLLGFSSQGDEAALTRLLDEHGYEATTVSSRRGVGPGAHRYSVLRLRPTRHVERKDAPR
jgi:methylase of polypeptide subunit release factors